MSINDATDHAEPATVGSYQTEGEAEVDQAELRAFGIEAVVTDQPESGALPVEGADGVTLQVRAADADEARRILTAPPTEADVDTPAN